MEDDEGWVLSASRSRSAKISTNKSHGTHHAVAASVGKFPFPPPDNRRHELHRSATTSTAPSPFQRNWCGTSPTEDAKPERQPSDPDEGYSLSPITCKCPFAFCRGTCFAGSTATTPAPLARPTTSRSISPTEDASPAQRPPRVPVDLAAI